MIDRIVPHISSDANNGEVRFRETADMVQKKVLPLAHKINAEGAVLHVYIDAVNETWKFTNISQELWMAICDLE